MSLMTLRRAAALSSCFSLTALAAAAAPEPSYELVVMARPLKARALEAALPAGPVTVSYSVREVFAGDPGPDTVIVRHDSLADDDRMRLLAGDDVILLAKPDASNPGRWVGPAPVRATDEAVASFRAWGAPGDVRPERDVREVIASLEGEGTVELSEPEPVPAPDVPEPVEEVTAPEPAWPQPTAAFEPEAEARRHPVLVEDDAVRPVIRFEQEMTVSASALPDNYVPDPPYSFRPELIPPGGPGLPPMPDASVFGPELSERTDLRRPGRSRRELDGRHRDR